MIKTGKANHTAPLELELNQVMPLPPGGLPDWLPLIPADKVVKGRDGRTYENPGPKVIMANQEEHGVEVPFDLEHSTELKAPAGEPAPALGWVKEYKEEKGVLMGRVEWNTRGKDAVENKEYRYYSPAYRLEVPSRKIAYVKSIGLTNSPNLALPALNHEEEGENSMLKAILAALGLNAEAKETDVITAINNLKQDKTAIETNAQKDMVPKADYELALNRATKAETDLNAMKETDLNDRVSAAIDKAVEDGKIAPASKEYYKTSCNSEEALKNFKEFFLKAAPIVENNRETGPSGKPPETRTELNAEERNIADQLGLTDEEARETFLESK